MLYSEENVEILVSDLTTIKDNLKHIDELKTKFIKQRDSTDDSEMKRVYRRCVNKLEKIEKNYKDIYYDLNVLYHL